MGPIVAATAGTTTAATATGVDLKMVWLEWLILWWWRCHATWLSHLPYDQLMLCYYQQVVTKLKMSQKSNFYFFLSGVWN